MVVSLEGDIYSGAYLLIIAVSLQHIDSPRMFLDGLFGLEITRHFDPVRVLINFFLQNGSKCGIKISPGTIWSSGSKCHFSGLGDLNS